MNVKTFLAFSLLLSVSSCRQQPGDNGVTQQDIEELHALHQQFRQLWLNNDSAAVVNLFFDDAEIIPSNNRGDRVIGKDAIGRYWFPPAETTYVITGFDYINDSLVVDRQLAFWRGQSEVGWNTVSQGKVLSSSFSRSDFIMICKKAGTKWMILRQMWNVKPKN